MDLKNATVPNLTDGYHALLGQNLWLQEHHGWKDYLLSVPDTLAIIAILVGNNHGSFSVMESNIPEQRWLWLSPEAVAHIQRQGNPVLDSAIDVSRLDARESYEDILKTLGRDVKTGRRTK